MELKINNMDWKIIALENKEFHEERKKLGEEINEKPKDNFFAFGFCDQAHHTIYLNNYVCEEEKRLTLIHELVHAWLFSYGGSYVSYSEDALCDTVAASLNFINEIVSQYLKNRGERVC